MPFTDQDVQTMTPRQIDSAIAEYLFGWTQVSNEWGLPPNASLANGNFRHIPLFTSAHESAEEVRAWIEQNHPWLDHSGTRATVVADYDELTGPYIARVISNHEDPKDPAGKRCGCGETLHLAYGRLALLAWIEING